LEGGVGPARWFPHHQNTPTPTSATRIMPIMVKRIAQRIASRATRKKIANRMTPAMMEMVVDVMKDLGGY
jgi:hypothetical protein